MADRPTATQKRLDAIEKAEVALAAEKALVIKQAANYDNGWTKRRVAAFLKSNPAVAQRLTALTKAGDEAGALALQTKIVKAVKEHSHIAWTPVQPGSSVEVGPGHALDFAAANELRKSESR